MRKVGDAVFMNENTAEKQLEELKSLIPTPEIEKQIKLLEYGIAGEQKICFELANGGTPCYVVQDLYLEYEGLTAQIDFLVICQKCNYVIECKNLYGNISVSKDGTFTRKTQYGTEAIYSPITQNERHIRLIKKIIRSKNLLRRLFISEGEDDFWKNVVVLANPKSTLDNKFGGNILRADQLANYIRETENASKNYKAADKAMRDVASTWLSRSLESPGFAEKHTPTCPRCGELMVKRLAKKGEHAGEEFYGCPNYPKCRGVIYAGIQKDSSPEK